MKKRELRRYYKVLRQKIPDRDRQTPLICQHLIQYIETTGVRRVFSYAAFGEELDLSPVHAFLWKEGYLLHLPRLTSARDMVFHRVYPFDNLIKNIYGIGEPVADSSTETEPSAEDLIIIPALAVDEGGYRLGYGGGFYDRFLEHRPQLRTLCPVFTQQRVKTVYPEAHDVPMRYICDAEGCDALLS